MSDHTPGPWTPVGVSYSHPDSGRNGVHWYVRNDSGPLPMDSGLWGDQCEANAHLIAAAPELLAALEDLINNCECRETGTVIADFSRKTPVDRARAAIAKAKGGGDV